MTFLWNSKTAESALLGALQDPVHALPHAGLRSSGTRWGRGVGLPRGAQFVVPVGPFGGGHVHPQGQLDLLGTDLTGEADIARGGGGT